MKTHTQVLVIGGGAMGCSLIYHLCKLGWCDVMLVEKNELTAGSTWHAAGLCTHFAHNLTIMALRAHSIKLYNELLAEDTGQAVSFHQCGALRITKVPDRMHEFQHVQGLAKFAGHDLHILSPKELREIYPLVDTSDLIGAIYEPEDGYVDPSQATHAMAKGARQRGAVIERQCQVTDIQRQKDHWLVTTNKGQIIAEHIVNAAGTWCREIGTLMGLDLPVVPMLHQYLVSDRLDAYAQLDHELPMIRDPDESWYCRQERDGVIIGPYEKEGLAWGVDGIDPNFGMELLPEDMERLLPIVEKTMGRIPATAEARIKQVVNGPITFTPDANPLIGPGFGLDNAWLLTGSSMGVMEGGGAGHFLAQWMVDREPPMDALAVDSRRFGGYADRNYRVARAKEAFGNQFAIHYPHEERQTARNARKTPLHDTLEKLGAEFGTAYGWERPNWFKSLDQESLVDNTFGKPKWFDTVGQECHDLHNHLSLADLSIFSKFVITGSHAKEMMASFCSGKLPSYDGKIKLLHHLTTKGGVALEFTLLRRSATEYYLVTAAAAERITEDALRIVGKTLQVQIENVTESIAIIAVMGPKSMECLQSMTQTDLSPANFPWMSALSITIADTPCEALKLSYVGELGCEIHLPSDQAKEVFNKLHQHPLRPALYGAMAMDSMRLEMGYLAWGADYTTERLLAEHSIIDQENWGIETEKVWMMLLCELDIPENNKQHTNGDIIYQRDKAVGLVSSAGFGQRLQNNILLGFVDIRLLEGLERLNLVMEGCLVELKIISQRKMI